MIKIIHAADLHLDSPFEALGEMAAARRGEMRETLARIADITRERGADMLLLAGDLLDSDSAYAETFEAISSAFGGLDCPVFIAPGNHDRLSPASPYLRSALPENVHIFRGGWSAVELPEKAVRIYGAGYRTEDCPALLRGFSAERQEGWLNIGLLHGDITAADSKYCPISPEDIAQSGFDYLALGHKHTYSGLLHYGQTVCAYPGCPEGRGFDECGEKGIIYLELDESGIRSEFIPVCRRRYEMIELDISDGIPAPPALQQENICRVILTGETDAAPRLAEIEARWQEYFYALQLRDRSRLRRDIWEGSGRDSLRGLFLQKMHAKYEAAATEAEREKIIRSVRWGLAALDGGEAVSSI